MKPTHFGIKSPEETFPSGPPPCTSPFYVQTLSEGLGPILFIWADVFGWKKIISESSVVTNDTASIDFVGFGNSAIPLSANSRLSVQSGNVMEIYSDGLYVPSGTPPNLIDGGNF